MLVISDFLQLPSSGRMIFEHLTPTDVWHLFKLHELAGIVHQNSDPEFVELLNRLLVLVSKLYLMLQPYMPWQILI